MRQNFSKDPNEVLDYTIDFASLLDTANDETIASVAWSASGSGLTIGTGDYAATNDDTSATVWLSAGTVGTTYSVTCRATTDATPARVFERSISVRIVDR